MIELSKEQYDIFYENNLEILNRTPKYNPKENSVTYLLNNNQFACKWVEYEYNKVKYFVSEV